MKYLAFSLLFLACLGNAFAQQGYSSASYSMGKQRADGLMIPKASEIVVEEYFNYHTHALPLPTAGKNVALDMRWGNAYISSQQPDAVLQVGFTTLKQSNFVDETPLNICIVIDRSGSMSGDRIENARKSALTLAERLRPQDFVSIVVFDHTVQVLLENESAKNKQKINQIIQSIHTGGSTDLNSGLIRGYETVAKFYQERGNNKVLLLTDVLTNTGEVDVEAIVKNATNYSQNHQISITLVAIGVQVNDALARQITRSGKHSFHYVNDSEDIKKIFVDEVESIFSTIAKEVKLTIEYDENLELTHFYGYEPSYKGNTITLNLNNMNAGLTQVVLAKFKAKKAQKTGKAKAILTYFDLEKGKQVSQKQDIELTYSAESSQEILTDKEVRKCVSIADMAGALYEMAKLLDTTQPAKNDYQKAKDLLDIQIGEVKKRYQNATDQDVRRVLEMLEKYASALGTVAKR
jgi:Ca-activated chloride channel homolog